MNKNLIDTLFHFLRDIMPLICVAPNGAYRQKTDHPALPTTADELAETARKCRDSGANMIHIHVREDDGRHSLASEKYQAALSAIRAQVGDSLLLQITTESGRRYNYREQFQCVYDLKPPAFSVAVREALPEAEAKSGFVDLLNFANKNNIQAQYILYSPEELKIVQQLMAEKIITEARPHVLYVIGKKFSSSQESYSFLEFLAEQARLFSPQTIRFMTCGFGAEEHNLSLAALAAGGDARLGFENNLTLPDGSTAKDNAALIEALVGALPKKFLLQ